MLTKRPLNLLCKTLVILLGIFCLSNTLQAQDLRTSLFKEADTVLEEANQVNAKLLAPDNYKEGMEHYQEASKDLQKGDNIQDIRKKLIRAVDYFKKAIEATKLAEVTFSSMLDARSDAMDAQAAQFATEKWKDAEDEFKGAARELEDGDAKDAKEEGARAEKLYRDAELIAIKSYILKSARDLLAQADDIDADDQAPLTLQKAKRLVRETEKSLNNNRYDTDEARNLAKQADYEAKHTLYLQKHIEELEDSDRTLEEVILMAEAPLGRVANSLLINAKFDEGYKKVVNEILAEIYSLKDSLNNQSQTITGLEQEYEALESANANLSSRLENLTNERTEISQRVEAMSKFRQQFNTVDNLFTNEEAQVIRDDNDAVIRLKGLNFDVGQSVIKSSHFGLLTKVKRAINTFPGSKVIIEGHTDSQGSDELNLELSQERAKAVMSYLVANMEVEPIRFEAIGFGETKPIANNETAQGRTLNRRIDVIIKPDGL